MKDKYIHGIDLLKIMACICVVGAHVLQRHEDIFNEVLFCAFTTWAIPMFFVVNGYLLLGKKNLKYRYVFKKTVNMLATVFFWNIVYSIAQYVQQNLWINPVTECLKNIFLQRGAFWFFWFLGALALIWGISPILHTLLRGKYWKHILMLLGGGCIILDVFSKAFFLISEIAVISFVPQAFRIWLWCFYFYLGGVLAIKEKNIFYNKKYPLEVFLIIVIMLNTVIEYVIGFSKDIKLWPEYFYGSALTIIETVLIFLIVYRIRVKRPVILRKFSECTIGIYVLHMFMVIYISKFYDYQYVIINIILILTIVIVSAFITEFLLNVPLLRRFVSFTTMYSIDELLKKMPRKEGVIIWFINNHTRK